MSIKPWTQHLPEGRWHTRGTSDELIALAESFGSLCEFSPSDDICALGGSGDSVDRYYTYPTTVIQASTYIPINAFDLDAEVTVKVGGTYYTRTGGVMTIKRSVKKDCFHAAGTTALRIYNVDSKGKASSGNRNNDLVAKVGKRLYYEKKKNKGGESFLPEGHWHTKDTLSGLCRLYYKLNDRVVDAVTLNMGVGHLLGKGQKAVAISPSLRPGSVYIPLESFSHGNVACGEVVSNQKYYTRAGKVALAWQTPDARWYAIMASEHIGMLASGISKLNANHDLVAPYYHEADVPEPFAAKEERLDDYSGPRERLDEGSVVEDWIPAEAVKQPGVFDDATEALRARRNDPKFGWAITAPKQDQGVYTQSGGAWAYSPGDDVVAKVRKSESDI